MKEKSNTKEVSTLLNNPIYIHGKAIVEGRGLPSLIFILHAHLNFLSLTFHNKKSRSVNVFF